MKASTVLLTSVFTVSCIESSWDVDGDRDHTSRDVETKGEVATPRRSFSFLFFFFCLFAVQFGATQVLSGSRF